MRGAFIIGVSIVQVISDRYGQQIISYNMSYQPELLLLQLIQRLSK